MVMKIGISGDIGSFSEQAGISYTKKHAIFDYEIVPLINMDGVLKALNQNQIDLGVFPVINNNSGIVFDAFVAMGKYKFSFIESMGLSIEQCLISKTKLDLRQIDTIYSYKPAFNQCEKYIEDNLKHAKLIDYGDMARAIRDLSCGKLNGNNIAVIGPKLASDKFDLMVISQGIEDIKPNITNFIIVKRLD